MVGTSSVGFPIRLWGTIKRYGVFFLVGVLSELFGLLVFRFAEEFLVLDWANAVSLPPAIVASFLLHNFITWRDRPGSIWLKGARYLGVKGWLFVIRLAAFPIWRRVLVFSCPLYGVTHLGVDLLSVIMDAPVLARALHPLFTCGWMSLALFDFTFALTLSFIANDSISWAKGKEK